MRFEAITLSIDRHASIKDIEEILASNVKLTANDIALARDIVIDAYTSVDPTDVEIYGSTRYRFYTLFKTLSLMNR